MRTDVLIVGAGPTGLMLAGDLAEAGVRVTVVERRRTVPNITRAFGVHARTLEQLDMRGMADDLLVAGARVRSLRLFDRIAVDLSRLPSAYNFLLITPQYEVERVLQQRLDALGVIVARGAQMLDLVQDDDGVDVRVVDEDGEVTTWRASYVVGADGVHSRVRESLGLPFPGTAVLSSIMLADVRLTAPPADVLTVNAVGDAFAFVAPFGDGWYRVFAWDRRKQVADDAPLELDEIREVTRRALGTDLGMHDPRWMSRFRSDERQVPRYRVGRVFLAGDAAHVHSPAGGQGMNTGIQDAANLGWKLAAAVHGWAPPGLLDSYHDERHPVGKAVLRSSGMLIRLAMVKSRFGRAVRNVVGRRLLRSRRVADRLTGTLSGIGFGYAAPHGAAELVGRRMPDMRLRDGRLFEALRGGTFVLLADQAAAVPAEVSCRVRVAQPLEPGAEAVLVRPDGYVAWAGPARDFAAWAKGYFGIASKSRHRVG